MAEGVLTPAANPPVNMYILSQAAIPFIKASSGSMANNGAVTAMTALPKTYSNGAYLYLPANAIQAGSAAGWYWFVGSSTTAGTVYNSTYTSGTPIVGTTTAFATTGPGAFTGDTGAVTFVTITVPANSLGINGSLDIRSGWVFNNTAGTKAMAANYGGTAVWSQTQTNQLSLYAIGTAQNRGSLAVQTMSYMFATQTSTAKGQSTTADGTVDTAASQTVTFTATNNTATDHTILEHYQIQVMR